MSPALRKAVAVGVFVVTAVVCLTVGVLLGFVGSIPFSSTAPFTGEPVDASAGEQVTGALLIIAGLVVGLLGPASVGLWARRWGRAPRRG